MSQKRFIGVIRLRRSMYFGREEGGLRCINDPSSPLSDPEHVQACCKLTAPYVTQAVGITYRQTKRMQRDLL